MSDDLNLMEWQKKFIQECLEDMKEIAETGNCSNIGIFLAGPPGTGKSYALNELVKCIQKLYPNLRIATTATTGAASTRLKNAKTLSTFLSIGGDSMKLHLIEEILPIMVKRNPARVTDTEFLIMDEVSMLSITHYNNLDICFRRIRNDPRPFGGMYVIFVGDPYQLPPIPQDSGGGCGRNTKTFVESCLESQNRGFRYIVANQMKRSEESSLLQNTLLQTISDSPTDRNNATATLRNNCYHGEMDIDDVLDLQQETGATILSPSRLGDYSVDEYNNRARARAKNQPGYEEFPISPAKKLHSSSDAKILKAIGGQQALASEENALESRDSWTTESHLCTKLPYMVRLKVEYNGKTLFNGDIVEVIRVNKDESVLVYSFRFKEEMTITRQQFKSEWEPSIGYEGYPLLPCSAMTIHKAQGATLEAGIIFEVRNGYCNAYLAHMWYTAFSRVKRIEDIRLTSYLQDLLDHPLIQDKLSYTRKLPYMKDYLRPV